MQKIVRNARENRSTKCVDLSNARIEKNMFKKGKSYPEILNNMRKYLPQIVACDSEECRKVWAKCFEDELESLVTQYEIPNKKQKGDE